MKAIPFRYSRRAIYSALVVAVIYIAVCIAFGTDEKLTEYGHHAMFLIAGLLLGLGIGRITDDNKRE